MYISCISKEKGQTWTRDQTRETHETRETTKDAADPRDPRDH